MNNEIDPMVAGIVGLVIEFALFLTFLILKLTAVIAWSWLWVAAPLWIPLGIGIVLSLFGFNPYK